MLLYAFTILVSAFLLFEVQPIIARSILPWFGGSAGVWTTCLLFFQCVLLLGYLYAHWLERWVRPRMRTIVHIALLAVSVVTLPILPSASWKPMGGEDPTLRILALLAVTVGLPYFLLSTTGPLLQAWYARRYQGAIPYRLYALSNAGSMFALVAYPALIEPWLGTRHQGVSWSWAYVAFALLCGATALRTRDLASAAGEAPAAASAPAPIWLWIGLPACASVLLLATTNHLTQNIAAVPFLWILPLTLYLLSFILCFESKRWYRRNLFFRLFAVAIASMAYSLVEDVSNTRNLFTLLIPLFSIGLFICCMVCHGELFRLRPHPSRLTTFYVMIALGGALGGVFVALIAPRVFPGFWELRLGIAGCALLVFLVLRADATSGFGGTWKRAAPILAGVFVLTVAGNLGYGIYQGDKDVRVAGRNFYGRLRVYDTTDDDDEPYRDLAHGTITHGEQYLDPKLQNLPTTYYSTNSGAGLVLRQEQENGPMRVGVIGLGTGTLAAYGRAGDYYRFYDINPLVVRIAETQFTYLKNSPARVEIAMGDARLSLEREPPENFDVLAVDAFSGDAIPIHLLTREALVLYFRHLKADGVLAVHVSNKHLDLAPVVKAGADSLHKKTRLVINKEGPHQVFSSDWVLVTANGGFFDKPLLRSAAIPVMSTRHVRLWTDDYSNLFSILK